MTRESQGGIDAGRVFRAVALLIAYSAILAGAKFWLAGRVDSTAIGSDGWNNLADLFYSVLLALGFYVALQPADQSHPQGHRRFESVVGLIVGIIIFFTGVYILAECRRRYFAPRPTVPDFAALAFMAAFMRSKIWVGRFCLRAGETLRRPALTAVGRDQQADVFATLSALVGYACGAWGAPALDPICGGIISLWVFKVGVETIVEHVNQLTGRAAPPYIMEAVVRAAGESRVLSGINDLRIHHVGPEYQVSFNVYADKALTLETVHDAEEDLKRRILEIPGVSAVFIHIEPAGCRT